MSNGDRGLDFKFIRPSFLPVAPSSSSSSSSASADGNGSRRMSAPGAICSAGTASGTGTGRCGGDATRRRRRPQVGGGEFIRQQLVLWSSYINFFMLFFSRLPLGRLMAFPPPPPPPPPSSSKGSGSSFRFLLIRFDSSGR